MLNEIYRMLDPVAFAVGPFVVRWYGIAYVAGFVCAALVLWQVAKRWRVRWMRTACSRWCCAPSWA